MSDKKDYTCYQCDEPTNWLAPDSRCGNCTRLTVAEIKGQDVIVEDRSDDVLCFLESADESVLIHYSQLYGCMNGIHSIHDAIENAEGFESFYETEVNF